MSKANDVFKPQAYLLIALEAAGVCTKIEKVQDRVSVLASVLAANHRDTVRDIVLEVADRICNQNPKLNRTVVTEKVREFLFDLQKKGQKAAARLRKKMKKYFRKLKK